MPEADMWKVLLLLACTVGSLSLVTCDDGDTNPTAETNPTEETKATEETQPTGETGPTDSEADPDDECDGYPPICGENEVYDNCTYTGCILRKCSELGFPLNCDQKCTPGCVCKDSYVRNDYGVCIPIPDCPSCGGDKNAQQGCGSHCGHSCSDYNKPPRPCPLLCIFNGCVCRPGFVYDYNVKACVKPKDCTPICQVNEEYSSCVNGGCSARNCSQLGKPVPCVKIDPEYCIKGCVCVTGYLRAANGTCVPKDQCTPKCDKPHEVYDECPAPCPPRRCDVNEAVIKCKAPPKPGDPECNPGCRCADNYYRNATGTCVLKKQCEKPLKCDRPNEVYNACPGICPPQECGVGIIFCPRNPEYGDPNCRPSCICIDGYVRNDAKECIPKDDCPKPCGQNEYWEKCIIGCRTQSCEEIGLSAPGCPGRPGDQCDSGCRCKPKYFRNADNVCVPESECPKCGKNEHWWKCISDCSNQTCADIGKVFHCPNIPAGKCKSGCRCDPGTWRDANNVCVPEKECPCGGDPNAMPGCGYNCGKTCETYKVKHPLCPRIECTPDKCDCKPGFVFDSNLKKCVLPKDCTPSNECPGQNEFFDTCISGCSNQTCDTIGKVFHCPIQTTVCRTGCRCNPGFYRNADNVCVAESECPPICQVNEEYSSCVNGGCSARNCSQLGKPVPCVDPKYCIKGCVCVTGYLRAANGTCVPKDQCTPKCDKPHEVYDECPAPCPPRRCDVNEAVIKCKAPPKPGDPECNPGCRCADNYYRNATGTCVLKKQCEKPLKCDRPNEVYNACPGICPPQECGVGIIFCPRSPQYGDPNCRPSCICIDGYVRNDAKECIPKDECPCGGDPNAMPGCGYNCGKTCETYKVKHPLCPRIECTPDKCDCKPGFVFDSNLKKCVLPKDCTPSNECPGQNEFFDTCISGCSNQTCDTIGKVFHCPIQTTVCRTGCRCNPGFYRNADNVCVAESECPTPDCPEGEIYSWCPTVKCDGDYCPKTRNSPLTCPVGIVCDPPRCVCGFNRHRDRKTGKCIATAACPPFKCDGPNEEYQSCPATCPGENCTDYIYSTQCPPFRIGIVVPCIPKCKCKQGYYRNSDGTCIPGPQCGPKICTSPVPLEPITTTNTPPTTGSGNNSGDAKTGLASLQAGIAQFTGKFLYDRIKANSGQNVIASPFSVFTPLAQLALYANGDCLKQLTSVLNIASKQDIRAAFPALAASYDGQTSVNFSTAAKVYSNKDFPLSDGFKKDSVDVIHAEAQELNFNAPAEAADIINKYVESKTNNRIKDLIQPSDLSALTRIVLVNAIYFKGDWLYSFNTKDTKDADFYLSDGTTTKTKLMYQQGQFNYGEVPELDCEVLEMFYTGKNFSMVIVLPNAKDGIMKTAESLQDSANFNKVLGSMRSQKVKVYVPSFEISTTTDLADILQQEGVTKIFDKNDSGLSGMLQKPEDTYVSKAIQKAFILVNEVGSEAAAANGVIVTTRALPFPPPETIVFRADHPFLFYIRVQATTLFCGAFVQ